MGRFGPIILTPSVVKQTTQESQTCVDEWHEQYGMVTALVHARPRLTLHIEKSMLLPQCEAHKADWQLTVDHVACKVCLGSTGVNFVPRQSGSPGSACFAFRT